MEQGLFLQRLSDALEGSKNKIETKLPVGSCVMQTITFGFMEENHSKKIKILVENF